MKSVPWIFVCGLFVYKSPFVSACEWITGVDITVIKDYWGVTWGPVYSREQCCTICYKNIKHIGALYMPATKSCRCYSCEHDYALNPDATNEYAVLLRVPFSFNEDSVACAGIGFGNIHAQYDRTNGDPVTGIYKEGVYATFVDAEGNRTDVLNDGVGKPPESRFNQVSRYASTDGISYNGFKDLDIALGRNVHWYNGSFSIFAGDVNETTTFYFAFVRLHKKSNVEKRISVYMKPYTVTRNERNTNFKLNNSPLEINTEKLFTFEFEVWLHYGTSDADDMRVDVWYNENSLQLKSFAPSPHRRGWADGEPPAIDESVAGHIAMQINRLHILTYIRAQCTFVMKDWLMRPSVTVDLTYSGYEADVYKPFDPRTTLLGTQLPRSTVRYPYHKEAKIKELTTEILTIRAISGQSAICWESYSRYKRKCIIYLFDDAAHSAIRLSSYFSELIGYDEELYYFRDFTKTRIFTYDVQNRQSRIFASATFDQLMASEYSATFLTRSRFDIGKDMYGKNCAYHPSHFHFVGGEQPGVEWSKKSVVCDSHFYDGTSRAYVFFP